MKNLNKIICGDALEELRKMPSESVDLVVTSPPYNKHSANRKHSPSDSWNKSAISYGEFKDDLPEGEYRDQQRKVITELLRIIKSNGSIFYNHKYRIINHRIVSPELWLEGFIVRQVIIWDRGSSPALDPIRFMPTYEQIYWITRMTETPFFTKEGFQMKDIWRISPETGNEHPAPFPEELVGRCIRAACPENGIVLDPFIGSGTTAVAAKMLGRNYIGIEINPEYVKMAENRLRQEVLF